MTQHNRNTRGRRLTMLAVLALLLVLLAPTATANDFIIQDADESPLFVANGSTGNIGIGLLQPDDMLHVDGGATLGGTLAMSDQHITGVNQIQDFFAGEPDATSDTCDPGEAVQQVNDDGTYECVDIAEEAAGVDRQNLSEVLTEGHIANRSMDMGEHDIDGVGGLEVFCDIVDDAGTVIWNGTEAHIDTDRLSADSVDIITDATLAGGGSVTLGGTLDTLSVNWTDADDLGSGGGLESNVVGSSELDDALCDDGEVLLFDEGSWGCVDRDEVGNATDLTGGDGIDPESITDGDTLSVAWGDAAELNASGNLVVGSDFDLRGFDLVDDEADGGAGLTIWDSAEEHIDTDLLSANTITLNLGSGLDGDTESVALGDTSDMLDVNWTDAAALIAGGSLDTDVVGTVHIQDGAVESDELATGVVNRTHIVDGTIREAQLDAGTPTDGYFLSYDSGTEGFAWVEGTDGEIQDLESVLGEGNATGGTDIDMQDADLLDIGNLEGTDIVHSDQIASDQVGDSELVNTELLNVQALDISTPLGAGNLSRGDGLFDDGGSLAVEAVTEGGIDVADTGVSVAWTDADHLGSDGVVLWGNADALDSGGDINDFSAALHLEEAGNISSGVVGADQLVSAYETGAAYDDVFVNRSGDTMTGDLDLGGYTLDQVGALNISLSDTEIAFFDETGITLHQPLSVESSGPMSVANGLELTDSTSNTIDSYGALYLQTSSGSPTDIVLDPTGVVSLSANLDMAGHNITNCEYINGVDCDQLGDAETPTLQEVLDAGEDAGPHNIDMSGSDILNAALVDGINLSDPGAGIGTDGENSYMVNVDGTTIEIDVGENQLQVGEIGSSEISSGAVGADELVSAYETGAAYDDVFVNRSGDTMEGELTMEDDIDMDNNNVKNVNCIGNEC